jgi:thiol-disulfide isomerase/thioredoxin
LPHIQKIYASAKDKGLAVLALNRSDPAEKVKDYWKESGFTFPALMAPDDVHQKFGVRAYPTNYVVNNKGEVVARFVGYDEQKLLNALKKLGIEVPKT